MTRPATRNSRDPVGKDSSHAGRAVASQGPGARGPGPGRDDLV